MLKPVNLVGLNALKTTGTSRVNAYGASIDCLSHSNDAESLLNFFYQFPIAVLRIRASGSIDLINPRALDLFSDLSLHLKQSDGWIIIDALNPGLSEQVKVRIDTPQTVFEKMPIKCSDRFGFPRHLALTVSVVSAGLCMVTLEDLTKWREVELAQMESDQRYSDLLENIPCGVVVHGTNSEILFANSEASHILGLSLEQLKGRMAVDPLWHFKREDGQKLTLEEYPVSRVIASGRRLDHFVFGVKKPNDNDIIWLICNAYPKCAQDGQVIEVVVSFSEITALKHVEQELKASEERLSLALKGSNDAPWDWDVKNGLPYYSDRWWQMLGYEVNELPCSKELVRRLCHEDDRERFISTLDRVLAGEAESYEVELRMRHKSGHYVPILSRGFILRDQSNRPIRVSGTNLDLTERKIAEAKIHHLAFYDSLTELPNRRLLMERLKRAMGNMARDHSHGALIFIDLDNFKEINDTLGHDVGDQLLKEVSQRLLTCVRDLDTVARLGGDEFVVLIEGLSQDAQEAAISAEQVGKKILETLNMGYVMGGRPYKGTPSMGIAILADKSPNIDTVLKQADLAMYQSKADGRNTMRFFDASMQATVEQRVSIEGEMRDALLLDQFELHYQPQVNIREGLTHVIGAEMLLRWNHPMRGMIAPNNFIPLAEETGLIIPIGRWVISQACEKIAQWANDPLMSGLVLSVNVSAHQFHDAGFVGEVMDALRETGASPMRLKLELTESALAKNIEGVICKMEVLRDHGVTFSLDDFGTGYSSLSYLKRMPLDQLKIDRSFVTDVLTDPNDATLARITIKLGMEMGLSVIAEGVETDEQRQFLQDAGCMDYQGYFFGRPVPVDQFEAMLRSI